MISIDGTTVIWLLIPIYVGVPVWWFFRSIRRFKRDQVDIHAAMSDLDVALLRRHDLVKRLAEAAKPHTMMDRNLVSDLTHYHERAMATRWNVSRHAVDEARLDQAVEAVYVAIDKASLNGDARFLRDLRREFHGSDKHVDVAIRNYNARVDRYNTRLKTFPYSVLGKRLMHLRPEDSYKMPDGAKATVTVEAKALRRQTDRGRA